MNITIYGWSTKGLMARPGLLAAGLAGFCDLYCVCGLLAAGVPAAEEGAVS